MRTSNNANRLADLEQIDRTRVADGYLFARHGYRCFYLGRSAIDRLHWLKSNPGKWRSLQDIQEEAARLRLAIESETNPEAGPIEPSGQTSFPDVRKKGGESAVTLVDAAAADASLPFQPTSLPVPVPTIIEGTTTKAELLRDAEVISSGATGSKEETTSLGGAGHKRGRRRHRQPENQKLPVEGAKASRMERMRIVLNSLREVPIFSHAAIKAGIHPKTLKNWLKDSAAGDVGYDLEWEGIEWRFHKHCESAIEEAHDKLKEILFQRAFVGYDKVLTYRGRVMYKIDPRLVGLGYQGPDAYLKDENGNPVPETVRKLDSKAMRFILEWYRPERWGKDPQIDAPRQSAVLIIGGDVTKKREYDTTASIKARKWKAGMRIIQEA
jgi:hypothetical protein